jgi:hypothetical protein
LVPKLILELLFLLGEGQEVCLHLLLELDQGFISSPIVIRLRAFLRLTHGGAHHRHSLLKLSDLLHQVLVQATEVLEFESHCMKVLLGPLDLLFSAEALVLEVEGILLS